jgi:dihydrofolate synthase/folylpolyglutamate synthase
LLVFADTGLDAVVLEVGLGGRLDAVNVVDADIAIVTRIGLDHTAFLGTTLEQIGAEKAGIFRRNRPAIVADPEPPASLTRHARAVGARHYQRGVAFECSALGDRFDWRCGTTRCDGLPRPPGVRLESFAAGLMALHLMDALPTPARLRELLASWQLAGRLQWVAGTPSLLLDVAHNPQAAAVLAGRLEASDGACRAIVGMLEDKDAEAFADVLSPRLRAWHTVTVDGPRGQSAAALARRLRARGCRVEEESASVAGALSIERARAAPTDTLVVCGSFHVVGPALAWLGLYSRAQRASI